MKEEKIGVSHWTEYVRSEITIKCWMMAKLEAWNYALKDEVLSVSKRFRSFYIDYRSKQKQKS